MIIQQDFKATIKIIKNLRSNSERTASHKFVADVIVILLPISNTHVKMYFVQDKIQKYRRKKTTITIVIIFLRIIILKL